MNKSFLKLTIIVIVIVGGMIGLGGWLKSMSPQQAEPKSDIRGEKVFARDGNYMTGSTSAKVTLVEFADFQCPACAAHFQPVKNIVDKYKSNPNFNFVYRNFPLPSHSNAKISANAAEAAGVQGKYWEMVELLYTRQGEWAGSINPTNIFVGYAQQLGLNLDTFKNEISTSKYIDKIVQDFRDGEALGVNATPTFYLNGQKLDSISNLDASIATLLQ